MKQVIVFPRGQLSPEDKAMLHEQGIPAVEADDPSQVVCLLPDMQIVADDHFMAALEAIKAVHHPSVNAKFINRLHERLSKSGLRGEVG